MPETTHLARKEGQTSQLCHLVGGLEEVGPRAHLLILKTGALWFS